MIKTRGLFSTLESHGAVAQMTQRVALEFLMQQLSNAATHLLNRKTRGRLFPRRFPCVKNQVAIKVIT